MRINEENYVAKAESVILELKKDTQTERKRRYGNKFKNKKSFIHVGGYLQSGVRL